MTSYEGWLHAVRNVPTTAAPGERRVTWDEGHSSLGICLTPNGEVEILIPGPSINVTHPSVVQRTEHREWTSQAFGHTVAATKLTLPKGPEFTPAAAWICAELDRHDVGSNPEQAFRRIEALIALVVDGLENRAEDFVGLLGEVILMRHLVEAAPGHRRLDIIQNWQGYKPSLRDLSISHHGVEVKATRGQGPTHHFQGVHQIERSQSEANLILVSVGIDMDSGEGDSLDGELERIGRALGEHMESEVVEKHMTELRGLVDRYGVSASTNLVINDLQRKVLRQKPFECAWVRAYDTSATDLGLPRRRLIAALSEHLVAESVTFDLRLPTSPAPYLVSGPRSVARTLLEAVGWTESEGS
ncbi:PD-(D/E)XK motif protein [Janibacter indicus]|uniref:PD-(D/E)XK motif protein n=1 Tax=Janibacter indicus TaxID=857417 RepID=UPI003EBD71C9